MTLTADEIKRMIRDKIILLEKKTLIGMGMGMFLSKVESLQLESDIFELKIYKELLNRIENEYPRI